MQYKYKKKLYKILFIVILLSFIVSLVGCDWFSLGLLNIFDPQAQIRIDYTGMNLEEGTIALEVYSLNEVEFIGSGFEYEYYIGTTKITELSKTVGATFYVAPSTSPGEPGPITTIDLLLYYQEAQDYLISYPLITEITCTINLIGTDGAGHDITKPVTFDLPALQPGIDVTPPTAVISVSPGITGAAPFTVVFDASDSTDDRRIASYAWDFGDGTYASGVTPAAHTYTTAGTYIVKLTVTDYWGNAGVDTKTITVGLGVASTITLQASPATVVLVANTGSSTIIATVKDAGGSPVPDGTAVTFITDFGTLSLSYVTTLNGIATTVLTCTAVILKVTVTATSGSVIGTVNVEFK